MIFAGATSLLVTSWLGPRSIKTLYELKIGQPIRRVAECPLLAQLHQKKKDTPTMGGILILFAMLISLFLWMDLSSAFTLVLCLTTLALGSLGAVDDYLKLSHRNSRGLKARKKMVCLLAFSSLIALYLLSPPLTGIISEGAFFHPPMAKEQAGEGLRLLNTQ